MHNSDTTDFSDWVGEGHSKYVHMVFSGLLLEQNIWIYECACDFDPAEKCMHPLWNNFHGEIMFSGDCFVLL